MWRQFVTVLVVVGVEIQARSLKTPPAGSPEQLPGQLWELLDQCSALCKTSNRRCLNPPRRCGTCLDGFLERDGLCFPKFNPADEVEAWKQALLLVNDEKPAAASRQEVEAPVAAAAAANDEEAEYYERLIAEENSYIPEDEEEMMEEMLPVESDAAADEEEEEEGTPKQEVVDKQEIIDVKETRSDGSQKEVKVSKEEKVEPASPKPKVKDEMEVHEMPTPAAMVQLAAKSDGQNPLSEFYTLAIVIGCAVVSIFVLVGAGLCYYRYHQNAKAAGVVEYPAFTPGAVVSAPREHRAGSGDRKLAQSAQMYHYQHQKQQMIAAERASDELNKDEMSEDEENEEGDYTVYECPGLAPTGEMEVKNPLFADEGATGAGSVSADSPKKD